MKTKKNKTCLTVLLGIVIPVILLFFGYAVLSQQPKPKLNSNAETDATSEAIFATETVSESDTTQRVPIQIQISDFSRLSAQNIQLTWSNQSEALIQTYIIQRRNYTDETSDWITVGEISLNDQASDDLLTFTDTLPDDTRQIYLYRINVIAKDPNLYEAKEGETFKASNIMVCIDPGHYEGSSDPCTLDSYLYTEGSFVLKIGLELRRILKENYGISSCMTRDSGDIEIDGYRNRELDKGHISLRGSYGKQYDCDLFVSLHTNANEDYANQCPTWDQPIEINKPIIIANQIVCTSDSWIDMCNEIGNELTTTNQKLGLSGDIPFQTVTPQTVREWDIPYNDSLNKGGTVCKRLSGNEDYYGVLRGATESNIPGIIIEHAYHTVEKTRELATTSDLCTQWANADASGISHRFLKN